MRLLKRPRAPFRRAPAKGLQRGVRASQPRKQRAYICRRVPVEISQRSPGGDRCFSLAFRGLFNAILGVSAEFGDHLDHLDHLPTWQAPLKLKTYSPKGSPLATKQNLKKARASTASADGAAAGGWPTPCRL